MIRWTHLRRNFDTLTDRHTADQAARLYAARAYAVDLADLDTLPSAEASRLIVTFGNQHLGRLIDLVADKANPNVLREHLIAYTIPGGLHHIAASQQSRLDATAWLPFNESSFSISQTAMLAIDFKTAADKLLKIVTDPTEIANVRDDCSELILALGAYHDSEFRTTLHRAPGNPGQHCDHRTP